MKLTPYILTLFTFLNSCSNKTKSSNKELRQTEKSIEPYKTCAFVYDTITDDRYKWHKIVLNVLLKGEHKGQLNHQDIAMFTMSLNPNEKGLYWSLTNKAIFALLEKDAKNLDYGLTQWSAKTENYNYFLEHVSNPICNALPIDSIKKIIARDMSEPHAGAVKMKKMILSQLDKSIIR